MSEIDWENTQGLEVRLRVGPHTFRYCLGSRRRPGPGPLFHDGYDAPPAGLRLPAVLQPCVTLAGSSVDVRALTRDLCPNADVVDAELVLPHGRMIPCAWITGCDEAQLDQLRRSNELVAGLIIAEDERVASARHVGTMDLWLQRLPRVVLPPRSEIADNTDAAVSMGTLLERFVSSFSTPDDARAHVRVTTGFLYGTGLPRLLALLENPSVQTLHILFSGRTDHRTARALTGMLGDTLREGLERVRDGDDVWRAVRSAAEAGRLDVRVYTDAFLHAKLFQAFDGIDEHERLRNGYTVVGSSNVSGSGLQTSGNLELDVPIEGREAQTRLYEWFSRRWEEAAPLEPPLLEVMDSVRPDPPPTFQTPGLMDVWRAGRDGALVDPQEHLWLLALLHESRMKGIELPANVGFPPDPDRRIEPTLEQEEGVIALAQRMQQARIGFLADSVGLGKTITAIGTAAYMLRTDLAQRVAVIAPEKLWPQWTADAASVGISPRTFTLINRHKLERASEVEAREILAPFDMIVVEEAHEALRNRNNRLWQHLRAHLHREINCRLLLVSATPWNNRREDIYNFLLLAWNDGPRLRGDYAGLSVAPLSSAVPMFHIQPVGQMPATHGVRAFEQLSRDRYQPVFDAVFVQRTRSMLQERLREGAFDFPERRIHAHNTPASAAHDALFARLADELPDITAPYREPFQAFLAAALAVRDEDASPASNLRQSFLIQLYKRAESSLFALAASLATVRRRLSAFRSDIEALRSAASAKEAVADYLERLYLRVDEQTTLEEVDVEQLSAAEKARYNALRALLTHLDEGTEQIASDEAALDRIDAALDFRADELAPKELLLMRAMRDAYGRGHKPILVAGYADTATRTFVRVIDLVPDARVALVLGGGEAWLYRPERHARLPLRESEWSDALTLDGDARRTRWLSVAGRADRVDARRALDSFAPTARATDQLTIAELGGEIDILIGSEAISVGQNLQDSTCLLHLDLPWNPMVIEQRIGRIDRRGGGRPDPDRPGGRPIVDIHYCWSDAAVEREVTLRTRLQTKAEGALADTHFDEILLYELAEQVRAKQEGRPRVSIEQVLGAGQQAHAEQSGRPPEIARTGSELDALRCLADWLESHPIEGDVRPVVAAGLRTRELDPAWWVTLAVQPRDRRGEQIAGGPRHLSFPAREILGPDPDLEAVVRVLVGPVPVTQKPGLRPWQWTEAVRALDGRLQQLRSRLVEAHNAEYEARLATQVAARRDPGAKLKVLIVEARDALRTEIERTLPTSPRMAWLGENRVRVRELLERGLDPTALPTLLGALGETRLVETLLDVRDFPGRALETDFQDIYDRLCTTPSVPPPSLQMELPDWDGFWSDLEVRVVAATFGSPEP